MKNILTVILITFWAISCETEKEIIDVVSGTWTLDEVNGSTFGLDVRSVWNTLKIEQKEFVLSFRKEGQEEVIIAQGVIEVCESMMMRNCYVFSVENNMADQPLAIELSSNKVVSYIDSKLTLSAICCEEPTYVFQ